ncbi:MAG: DUF3460 family protein [Leptothrix ochracea]
MPLFWKPYQSEATQFIESLKKQDPTLESRQIAGRALLWEQPVSREEVREVTAARVAQQPYVYQTHA